MTHMECFGHSALLLLTSLNCNRETARSLLSCCRLQVTHEWSCGLGFNQHSTYHSHSLCHHFWTITQGLAWMGQWPTSFKIWAYRHNSGIFSWTARKAATLFGGKIRTEKLFWVLQSSCPPLPPPPPPLRREPSRDWNQHCSEMDRNQVLVTLSEPRNPASPWLDNPRSSTISKKSLSS